MGAKPVPGAPRNRPTSPAYGSSLDPDSTIQSPGSSRQRKPRATRQCTSVCAVLLAMADSYIAVFDAKYTYNFWRPVTAIRNGDIDGNDATEREPHGSLSLLRLCTLNIRALIALIALPEPPYSKPLSAMRCLPLA